MGSVDYLDRIRRLGGVLIMIHFTYIIIILSIAIGISYSPNHCRDGVCRVEFSVFDHHQHWCSHYLYGEGEHSFRSSSIFTSRCCPHRKRVCGSTSQRVALLLLLCYPRQKERYWLLTVILASSLLVFILILNTNRGEFPAQERSVAMAHGASDASAT